DNSGRSSLYVVSGRPLDDSMHPYPLKDKPNPPPHNHLFRNDGNGHFTDVTEQSGLDPDMYSVAVTAADYDNDGHEDLLVTGYGKVVLYHNDGNGQFTDVTEKAGIKVSGWAISSTWLDYDNDGWDDIYVANDRTENFLFRNRHDGTFEEIANDTGTAFGQNGEATSSMGPVFADFEGRGVLDLWVTDGHYNRFLRNTGSGGFE